MKLRQSVKGYAEFEDRTKLEIKRTGRLATEAELYRVMDARGCSWNVARIHLGELTTQGDPRKEFLK